MDSGVFALTSLFLFAAATGGAIVALSAAVGRRRPPPERNLPYECGLDPVGKPGNRFSVKYFLVAVLFIIFDVEIVFLYPWALAFRELAFGGHGVFLIAELIAFAFILSVALAYAWGRGALEWER
ncbi:MAG TPA: NADH-quinone oxidoreductase subunit A [bacterium]|nr:NADH-quinone oxidoreductase subunit A [bacterium]